MKCSGFQIAILYFGVSVGMIGCGSIGVEVISAEESDNFSGADSDMEGDTGADADTDADTGETCPVLPVGTETYRISEIEGFACNGAATCTLVTVDEPTFSDAWRIETSTLETRPYYSQMIYQPDGDIRSGDHVLFEYWSRCVSSTSGYCRTGAQVEQSVSPWTNMVEYYESVGVEWVFHQIPFVAGADYLKGQYQITCRLGYSGQIVEIAPTQLMNYGQISAAPRLECLPNTTNIYTAMEIISVPRTTAYEGVEYSYVTEVNGFPPPTLTIDGLPTWMVYDDSAKLIYGTPQAADLGETGPITIALSNGTYGDEQIFSINVEAAPP